MPKKQYKILIIDDEKTLLNALVNKFTEESFKTLVAVNGEDGLATALAERPDLILLDIIMPKMDGITMLKKLRLDKWGKTVPVILLTNLSDDIKVAEALAAGSNDYLVKTDWAISDVVKKVSDKLKHA